LLLILWLVGHKTWFCSDKPTTPLRVSINNQLTLSIDKFIVNRPNCHRLCSVLNTYTVLYVKTSQISLVFFLHDKILHPGHGVQWLSDSNISANSKSYWNGAKLSVYYRTRQVRSVKLIKILVSLSHWRDELTPREDTLRSHLRFWICRLILFLFDTLLLSTRWTDATFWWNLVSLSLYGN
jgi:hypothetical protein